MSDATTKPIIFSDASVRAILEGRKTQTRRIVKPPRRKIALWDSPDTWVVDPGGTIFGPGPYVKMDWWHVGDVESHGHTQRDRQMDRVRCPYGYPEYGDRLWVREAWALDLKGDYVDGYIYRATDVDLADQGWRPSIHMPRQGCRLVLRITRVRVERLQAISEEDALAEGSQPGEMWAYHFRRLWDGINGKRAPWASDPLVWVLDFEVERC